MATPDWRSYTVGDYREEIARVKRKRRLLAALGILAFVMAVVLIAVFALNAFHIHA